MCWRWRPLPITNPILLRRTEWWVHIHISWKGRNKPDTESHYSVAEINYAVRKLFCGYFFFHSSCHFGNHSRHYTEVKAVHNIVGGEKKRKLKFNGCVRLFSNLVSSVFREVFFFPQQFVGHTRVKRSTVPNGGKRRKAPTFIHTYFKWMRIHVEGQTFSLPRLD